jgi:alkyl hydroperoxide reductase subunit F
MVIGGGPAGLAATVYAARKRLNAILVSQDIGGQMNWTLGIENYLGYQFIEAPELIAKFQTQVDQFPIDQKIGEKVSRVTRVEGGYEVVLENGDRHQAKTAIVATGKRPRMLNVPGEKELVGRGVAYCAICDGPVFAGQRVAVVGGGNSALGAVLDMLKIAEHVDMVSLTPLTGDPILINQLSEGEKLAVYTEHETVRLEGDPLVEGMVIKDIKTGEEKHLDVTGVFVEIGLVPNSGPVKDLLELNKAGEIPVNCACETTLPGLFGAGDVTSVPEKQIVIAAGEGAKASLGAHRYLQRLGA